MTGFGRSEGTCCGIIYRVEIRSVNHRYCDTNVRLPDELIRFEQKVRSALSGKFSRGKFEVSILQVDTPLRDVRPELKISTIRQYQTILKELSKVFNVNFTIRKDIRLSDMLALKDMITFSRVDYGNSEIEEPFLKILDKALDEIMKMRCKEGRIIYKDLKRRIGKLESMTKHIERNVPIVSRNMKKRYFERIKELSEIPQLNMDRVYQELAMMVERMDITEEIVRVNSHIAQLKDKLDVGGVVGRTLDFLLQEVNREINTIASKASDMTISQIIVDMKAEAERIREQVQNIE